MHREILELIQDEQPEQDADHGHDQPAGKQRSALEAPHLHGAEVREHQARFTTRPTFRSSRLLRLRNLGGLIVLDFIDMRHRRDQQTVYQRMKEGLKRDKAKTHILPISQLGLMEMTRQRHTESIRSTVYPDCPYCKGRAKVKSPLTMSVEIQRKLQQILKGRPRSDEDFQLRIISHPTVLDRLRKEDEKILIEMEKRYFGKLSFRAEPAMHLEHFKIINAITNEAMKPVMGPSTITVPNGSRCMTCVAASAPITAAATTGPARQPRPTSSTPATRWNP